MDYIHLKWLTVFQLLILLQSHKIKVLRNLTAAGTQRQSMKESRNQSFSHLALAKGQQTLLKTYKDLTNSLDSCSNSAVTSS